MRRCSWLAGVALVVCGLGAARGQEKSIYLQATGGSLQFAETPHLFGATFGILDMKVAGPVAMGADFRGASMKRGGSQGPYTDQALDMGQLGFRITAAPGVLPLGLKPYAEALFGLGYWRGGLSVLRQDRNHTMFQGVGGVDLKVSHLIDWRVVEFTYGRAGALPGHIEPETLSTGLVIHIPAGFFKPAP